MRHLTIIALACMAGLPAAANDMEPQMRAYLENNIREWAQSDVLVAAIQSQNAETAAYSQDDIDALDSAWRAEVGLDQRPTISPVLESAASDFLRDVVAASGGTVTEIFITDARGLNVAASDVTSDYWQGDEAKFTETFGQGPDAVHFGEIEFDESSQAYQGQISLTLVDPASRQPVGSMTVGVNAEALF